MSGSCRSANLKLDGQLQLRNPFVRAKLDVPAATIRSRKSMANGSCESTDGMTRLERVVGSNLNVWGTVKSLLSD